MDNNELRDNLENAFETGYLHLKRLNFVNSKVKKFLPITRDNYCLQDEDA